MQPSSSTSHPLSQGHPASRKIVLCVGPGGVGKTTCAAALALAAARGGRRVLVVTIDPSRRLAQALGFAASVQPGVELPVQTPALANTEGSLHALLLDGQVVFDRLVAAYATDAAQAKRIVNNPLYKTMTEHLGGALEYAAIAQLRLLHREGRYDLIVLDTPPTANALDFLQAPERIQELVTNPAIRLLTGTGRLGSRLLGVGNGLVLKVLGAMGGGEFVRDLGIFLRDFSVVLDQFHRQAGDFQALLTSETTGAFLVTSAATFSVREAVAFLGVLHGRSLRVDGVVLNRVTPPFEPFPEQDACTNYLRAQVGADKMARLRDAYNGLRVQGARSRQAIATLKQAYGQIPVWALPRREPPPTSLAELHALERDFVCVG